MIPVVAVFKEILKKSPHAKLEFWCDKRFYPQASKIMSGEFGESVKISKISSGKFRRYTHLTLLQHLMIPGIVFGNFFDIFKNLFGLVQAILKLILSRPDVIFCKGGFVCVPAGVAAWILRIPIVIHDSDAHAGLANRILSKFAKKIATGAPLEFYNYPPEISQYVGIPVLSEFKKYTEEERAKFRQELGFDQDKKLVVVTGGGLGAARINNAIVDQGAVLTREAQVMLISGVGQYQDLLPKTRSLSQDFILKDFVAKDMWKFLAAADLVVARAGATSNLELAALAKPTILVPNARLTGGHQVKNAQVYAKSGAVEVVSDDEIEDSPQILSKKILEVLSDNEKMLELSENFARFAKPDSAKDVAEIVISARKIRKNKTLVV